MELRGSDGVRSPGSDFPPQSAWAAPTAILGAIEKGGSEVSIALELE